LAKDVEFHWETEEKKAVAILKEALSNASALKILDISDGAGQIVVGVDTSLRSGGRSGSRKTKIRIGNRVSMKAGSRTTPK
jgi:hypothetical protein